MSYSMGLASVQETRPKKPGTSGLCLSGAHGPDGRRYGWKSLVRLARAIKALRALALALLTPFDPGNSLGSPATFCKNGLYFRGITQRKV